MSYYSNTTSRGALSDADIAERAPSVFSNHAHRNTSDKYSLVPTSRVIDAFRDSGWEVTSARQSNVRTESREGFQKHELRFARRDHLATLQAERPKAGDYLLEAILSNATDGSASFNLIAGIWRCWCDNGCTVATSLCESASFRHIGLDIGEIVKAGQGVLNNTDRIGARIERFQQLELPETTRRWFAQEAHALRFPEPAKAPVRPARLLNARRRSDVAHDLWTTFNVIQENVVRGGQKGRVVGSNHRSRRASVRAVNGIDQSTKLNQGIFDLAERICAAAPKELFLAN